MRFAVDIGNGQVSKHREREGADSIGLQVGNQQEAVVARKRPVGDDKRFRPLGC